MTTPSWMPPFPYSVEDYESANGISANALREADRSSHERFARKAVEAYKASLKLVATFGLHDGSMSLRLEKGEIWRAGDRLYRLDKP